MGWHVSTDTTQAPWRLIQEAEIASSDRMSRHEIALDSACAADNVDPNRPGVNFTGVTSLAGELNTKRLELLHEAVPASKVIAALVNPTEPNSGNLARNLQEAARVLRICRLMTSSNLADYTTGRSAGLAPLSMRPT